MLRTQGAGGHTERVDYSDLSKRYENLIGLYSFDELLEAAELRLEQDPGCKLSLGAKIEALRHLYRDAEAIATLEDVVRRRPTDCVTVNMLGVLYKDVGDVDRAREVFERCIDLNPNHTDAYWYRSDISLDAVRDLRALQTLMTSRRWPDSDKSNLYFAAYRLAEKQQDYGAAFTYLESANRSKRKTIDYDVRRDLGIDEDARKVFSAARVAGQLPTSENELTPIFIMGLPRSGTTLVEQIIASHSKVNGGDECTALANAVMKVQVRSRFQGSIPQWLASCEEADWRSIARSYEENTRFIRADKPYHTDKNQFNYRSIGIIKASLANARVIVVDRDPMDVCFGCYRQQFAGNGVPFSYRFDELAMMYASYQTLVEHWQVVAPGFVLRVQYEELVQQPRAVIENILTFCGLGKEQSCFDFHKNPRAVKTLSALQVRQPIFTDGVGRWKKYEQSLRPLRTSLQQAGVAVP